MKDKRSIYSGILQFGVMKIPISIYRSTDDFCLPGSLYHENCGGKICEKRYCEDHPDDEMIQVFSGIDILGKIVKVDSELRNNLLERDAPLKVVSTHKLTELSNLIASSNLVVHTRYMVHHMHVPKNAIDSPESKVGLATLLSRLSVKKMFVLLSGGLSGCKRYAVLLPDGQLLSLYYAEELRDFPDIDGEIRRDVARYIDTVLEENKRDFPVFSLKKLSKKIDAWFMQHASRSLRPRKNVKKTLKEKVDA